MLMHLPGQTARNGMLGHVVPQAWCKIRSAPTSLGGALLYKRCSECCCHLSSPVEAYADAIIRQGVAPGMVPELSLPDEDEPAALKHGAICTGSKISLEKIHKVNPALALQKH